MNVQYWAPLRFVNSNLLSRARLVYVFGRSAQEVLIVMENDDVFGCGPKFSSYLRDEDSDPEIIRASRPVRIPELCGKNVRGFSYSEHSHGLFLCAYTANNRLYYWGIYFSYGATQATSFSAPQPPITFVETPTLYASDEFGIEVVEVVASRSHCLLLTSDGKIFRFGSVEQVAGGNSGFCAGTPFLIEGNLVERVVRKVSCGTNFSVAILDNGEVYTWGCNIYGQLGVGEEYSDQRLQYRVTALSDIMMENIICGESYVLAVSSFGELYTWGDNRYGQLGLGDLTSRYTPVKVEGIGRIIDIAATAYGSTSAAMNECNEVYVWGSEERINHCLPVKTEFDSLFDAFASVGNPKIMHRPMVPPSRLNTTDIAENIRNAFGDAETSDLTIMADERPIFVHKAILSIRSNYFRELIRRLALQEDARVLPSSQRYEVLYAYLRYLYYGDFEGSSEVAVESLKLAQEYNDLAWKKICENQVKRTITVENVAYLYHLTLMLNLRVLAKDCVSFAGRHMGDVMDTPGFLRWDLRTHRQFIRACHEQNIFRD